MRILQKLLKYVNIVNNNYFKTTKIYLTGRNELTFIWTQKATSNAGDDQRDGTARQGDQKKGAPPGSRAPQPDQGLRAKAGVRRRVRVASEPRRPGSVSGAKQALGVDQRHCKNHQRAGLVQKARP